jgi:hypothetical protein
MKQLAASILLLIVTAVASAGLTSENIRMPDGSLIRAGDTKTELLSKLGMPDMQQGGVFYYKIKGKLYKFTFSSDGKIAFISKQ